MEKYYSCKLCPKKFSEKSDIADHIKQTHECDVCFKTYSTKNLARHRRTHLREHECNMCDAGFMTKVERVSHLRSHGPEERGFICHDCGKVLSSKANLKSHVIHMHNFNFHLKPKIFKCEFCTKTFFQMNRLRTHTQRVHIGYICDLCGKKLSSELSLRDHMQVHQGLKPYECTVCERRFAHLNTHKLHMRTHTGEKPYKCQFCDKAFSQSNSAKVHMRMHTGERPFPCDLCEVRFNKSGHLLQHKRRVHKLTLITKSFGSF